MDILTIGKREYVIDRVDLPTSWTNYIGVKRYVRSPEIIRQAAIFFINRRNITESQDFAQTVYLWTDRDIMCI